MHFLAYFPYYILLPNPLLCVLSVVYPMPAEEILSLKYGKMADRSSATAKQIWHPYKSFKHSSV